MEPLQLPDEPEELKLNKAKPETKADTRTKMVPPLNTTEGRGAHQHEYPAPLTAKTEAQINAEPLQLPEEPERLRMDETKPDAGAGTKTKIVPPLSCPVLSKQLFYLCWVLVQPA